MNKKFLIAGIPVLILGLICIYQLMYKTPSSSENSVVSTRVSEADAINKIKQSLRDAEYQKTCGITGEDLKFSTTTSYDNNHLDFVVTDSDSTNIFSVDKSSGNVDCNAVINVSGTE